MANKIKITSGDFNSIVLKSDNGDKITVESKDKDAMLELALLIQGSREMFNALDAFLYPLGFNNETNLIEDLKSAYHYAKGSKK